MGVPEVARHPLCLKVASMTRKDVEAILSPKVGEKIDRRFRIKFSDGVTQSVNVDSMDDEGVLHSGPDGTEPQGYWTRFEDIDAIENG